MVGGQLSKSTASDFEKRGMHAGEKCAMSVHARAVALLRWLELRRDASSREIAESEVVHFRYAYEVLRYAMQMGAVERVDPGANRRSMRYRATGVPLLEPRTTINLTSFDGLLDAWGIARKPPELAVVRTRVYPMADGDLK
jgi:hypothetical protein